MIVSHHQLDAVDQESWDALATATVIFGHQSVGSDMVEGANAILRERADVPLLFAPMPADSQALGQGLWETPIGVNGDPLGKTEYWAQVVDARMNRSGSALVLHKYCYLDFSPEMDPEWLFGEYRSRVELLRRRHPTARVAHVTTPLVSAEGALTGFVKRLLGRPTAYETNAVRSRFNDLMRAEYGGQDPLFDLAALESRTTSGREDTRKRGGRTVPFLAEEWTDDGGHLNERGRRWIGGHFIVFLAENAPRRPSKGD